jgi:hypothetical protein
MPQSPSKAHSPRSSPSSRLLFSATTPLSGTAAAANDIPCFYFPKAAPSSSDVTTFRKTVSEAFAAHGGRVTAAELQVHLPKISSCPGYLAFVVFEHLGLSGADAKLGVDSFVRWWRERHLVGADAVTCVFNVLRRGHEQKLTQEGLLTFMQHVLRNHPGLEFLQVRCTTARGGSLRGHSLKPCVNRRNLTC